MTSVSRVCVVGCSSYRSFILLRKLPIFKNMEPACLDDVAGRLQDVQVPHGEYVVRAGEPGDGMYFIHAGAVQVLVETVPVDVLVAGCFFGEVALTAEVPRSADVMSLGATRGVRCDPQGSPLGRRRADPAQLFRLTKSDFDAVAERYPVLEERLHEVGMARVRRACSPHCSPLRALRRCSSFDDEGLGIARRGSSASGDSDPLRGARRCSSLSGNTASPGGFSLSPAGSFSLGRTPSASPAVGQRRMSDLPTLPSSSPRGGMGRQLSDLFSPSRTSSASPAGSLGALGLPQRRMSELGSPGPGLRIASPAPPAREPGEGPSPALLGLRRMSDILIDEDGESSLESWRAESRAASDATGAAEEEAEASCLESLRFLWGTGPPARSGSPHSGSNRSGSPMSRRSGSPGSRRSTSPVSRASSPLPSRLE